MNFKKIVTWSLTGLVGLLFIASALGKFTALEKSEMAIKMGEMGINFGTITYLAAVEILAAVLFLIPRTGILGFCLLTAYMGGAIAVHLTNHLGISWPCVILAFVWIVGLIRFPEIGQRLLGKA
jgi:hypothetical protein